VEGLQIIVATLPISIALPLMKPIWGSLVASSLVSVQPMTGLVSGTTFYTDYVYANAKIIDKMRKLLKVIRNTHNHLGHEDAIIEKLEYWIAHPSASTIKWDECMNECNEWYKIYKEEYDAAN